MIIGDNMNCRRLAYVLMTLSFIMIMSGSVSSFVAGLKKDRNETYRRILVVNDEFEIFSTNTSVFEVYRDDLYQKYLGTFYFETMYQNDSVLKTNLSNYENIVDEIAKNVKQLDSLCKEVYYPDNEANSKCVNYKSIYEQVVNYFVSDIHLYNDYVKKYNEYGSNQENFSSISLYSTKKDYIDYNLDKKYDGKEE